MNVCRTRTRPVAPVGCMLRKAALAVVLLLPVAAGTAHADSFRVGPQILAQGEIPLTRKAADAYADLINFVRGEATGVKLRTDQAVKDQFAQTLAASYSNLPY